MSDLLKKTPFALTARALLAAACRPIGASHEKIFAWWADLADAAGPVLLPFLTHPEAYAKAPLEELGLVPTPLKSLTPRRGEMWVLFCFRPGHTIDTLRESALRSDGFPLILEWRKDSEDSLLLSSALRVLAAQVRKQFGVDGWGLHPAFDRYGDLIDFTDPELFSDAEHVDNVASAWGALAAGLWCVTTGRFPPEWTFPTIQWDEKRGCSAGVAGLRQKLSVAADCGATVVTVARSQRREAMGILHDLCSECDGRRYKNLRLYPVRDRRSPKDSAAEVALGFSDSRRLRRRITAAILLPLLVALSLWGVYYWDTHRSFSKYYAAIVYHYGLPQGIYPVTPKDQRMRGSTFRFDYKGVHQGRSVHDRWQLHTIFGQARRLVRVANVNARDVPTPLENEGYGPMPMIQEFDYASDGRLMAVLCRKRGGEDFVSGQKDKMIVYESTAENVNSQVSLKTGDGSEYFYGAASLSQVDVSEFSLSPSHDVKNNIYQYVITRDDDGRMIRQQFQNELMPVSDGDGVGGFTYEYNADGLVSRRMNIDSGSTNRVANKWGVVSVSYAWNGAQLTNVVNRNACGRMVCDNLGVRQLDYRYDQYGNPVLVTVLDENGKRTYNSPTEDFPVCFAQRRFSWTHGLMRSKEWIGIPDDTRQLILPPDETPRSIFTYDERGDWTQWTNQDANGNLTTNATGICSAKQLFDRETGMLMYSTFYGMDGVSLARDSAGVCIYSNALDGAGNCVASYLFNEKGKLTNNNFGNATYKKEYDRHNRQIYELHLDVDGRPCMTSTFTALEISYGHRGRIAEYRYCAGDKDRTPSTNSTGVSRMIWQYDDVGHLAKLVFLSLPNTGNSIRPGKYGPSCAHYEILYDKHGYMMGSKHYDKNDKLLPMPGHPYAYFLLEYNQRRQRVAANWYDTNEQPTAPGINQACRIESRYADDGDYEVERIAIAPTNTTYALWNHPGVSRIVLRYAPNKTHCLIESRYYSSDGEMLLTKNVVRVDQVVKGGVAERLGVLAGDIICICGDYVLRQETSQQEFNPYLIQTQNRSDKQLVVARSTPSGYRLLTFVFSEGTLGFISGNLQIPESEFQQICSLVLMRSKAEER